jgi:hypothetical protein
MDLLEQQYSVVSLVALMTVLFLLHLRMALPWLLVVLMIRGYAQGIAVYENCKVLDAEINYQLHWNVTTTHIHIGIDIYQLLQLQLIIVFIRHYCECSWLVRIWNITKWTDG